MNLLDTLNGELKYHRSVQTMGLSHSPAGCILIESGVKVMGSDDVQKCIHGPRQRTQLAAIGEKRGE